MNKEIANILREAADKIEAVCVPTTPAPLPELPTVPVLPESPEGFHPAMRGSIPCPAARESRDIVRFECGQWYEGPWTGKTLSPEVFYALRIGSDIAKLNGLEEDTKPDTARREWDASVCRSDHKLYKHEVYDDPIRWEYVRVREVLPGDPTPEQVEALVAAAENACRNFSHGSLEAALAPFRKP